MTSDKPKVCLSDRIAIGVFIMITRGMLTAALAAGIAIGVSVSGLADQPESVKDVTAIQAQQPDKGIGDTLSNLWDKTKETAVSLKDGLLNSSEREKQLREENSALRADNAEMRKKLAEKVVQAGIRHQMVLQCSKDIEKYLMELNP